MGTYEKIRDEPVCDFCCCRKPRWSFDCDYQHEVVAVEGETTTGQRASAMASLHFGKAWAACTRCSQLVMRRSVARLAQIATQTMMLENEDLAVAAESVYRATFEMLGRIVPHMGPRRRPTQAELATEPKTTVVTTDANSN